MHDGAGDKAAVPTLHRHADRAMNSALSAARLLRVPAFLPAVCAALFGNAISVGAVLSGVLTGPWASAFGYCGLQLPPRSGDKTRVMESPRC